MSNTIEPHSSIIDTVNFGEPSATNSSPVSIQNFYSSGENKKQLYDFSYLADTQGIKNIQTIFIDNYLNDSDIIYTNLNNGQIIVCPAKTQGYFPLLASSKLKFNLQSSTAKQLKINFYLMNYIIAQGSW